MFSRVAIVGLGVIGGSVGYAVRRAWPDVPRIGVDTPAVLAEALKHGAITEARNSAAGLEAADLIVLATPVMQIVQQIQELARAGTSATVTDVGSTKRAVMAAAARAQLRTFVGGHPMSGAAGAGLTHAREDLFDGCRWILVPEAAPSLAAFVTSLGADPHGMDAVSHDRVMAYVSHAPQVMASALAAAAH